MKVKVSPFIQILNEKNTLSVNRPLAHAIGLNNAIAYSALLGKFLWYNSADRLDNEGYFYSTADDLQESTTLTRRQQDKCIKELVELGLVKTKLKGLPAKRHFTVETDEKVLRPLLESGLTKGETLKVDLQNQHLTKSENLGSTKSETNIELEVEQNLSNLNLSEKPKILKDNNISSTTMESESKKTQKKSAPDKAEAEKMFCMLWELYPKGRKQGKPSARKHFMKALKDGVDPELIKRKLLDYKKQIEIQGTEIRYVKMASTWFNGGWEDEYITDLKQLKGGKSYGEPTGHNEDPFADAHWNKLL